MKSQTGYSKKYNMMGVNLNQDSEMKNSLKNDLRNSSSPENLDFVESQDETGTPCQSFGYKASTLSCDNLIQDKRSQFVQQQLASNQNDQLQANTALQSTYEKDKFINGAIIALKSQKFILKSIIEQIKQISDRTISDNYVRRVWDYWRRYHNVYFSTTSKTCMYTKHEAMQLYDTISKQYNPTNSDQSIIPYLKQVLQKHSITKKMLISYAQHEEVKGLDAEENYMKIKDAIESGEVSIEEKMVDVSVRIMISASQFQCKKNIEFQCFNKLKEVVQFRCIQWIGVVMGETLNGRGKYIYIHCKYDQNIIKRNKYLKRFLLEVIPSYFYSYNCVNSQKIQVFKIAKFKKLFQQQYSDDAHNLLLQQSIPTLGLQQQMSYSMPYPQIIQNSLVY